MSAKITTPINNNLPFILSPKVRKQSEPYLKYFDVTDYLEESTKSSCPICKVKHVRRTFAQGNFGQKFREVKLCFDYCPNCHRIKPETKHQEKMMSLVTNIRPLDPNYVYFNRKFAEERAKGRTTFTKKEFDSWRQIPSNQPTTEGA